MKHPTLYEILCAQIDQIDAISFRTLPWDRVALKRIVRELRAAAIEARACERMVDELVDIAREDECTAREQIAAQHRSANVVPMRRRIPIGHRPDFTPPSAA
jgi:hypothetical protein